MATMAYPEGAGLAPAIDTTGATQSPSIKRISWSAIFAGVTVAVAIQLLLSLLGAGIGLGLIEPMTAGTPEAGNLGLGTGLWWLVSNLVALVAGGYTAAWLAGNTLRFDGMLHGIVTWGVTLLLTFYLLTTAIGGLIGGAFGMVGGITSGAASAAGEGLRAAAPQVAAMTSVSPEQMLEQAKSYLQPANPRPGDDDARGRAEGARDGDAEARRRWRAGRAGARADHRHHGGTAPDQPRRRSHALRRGPGPADGRQGRGRSDRQGRRRSDRERGLDGCVPGLRRAAAGRCRRSRRRVDGRAAARRLRGTGRSHSGPLISGAETVAGTRHRLGVPRSTRATTAAGQGRSRCRSLAWIVLGLVAGFIASKLVNKTGEGLILDIVLGIVGAVVGGFVFNQFGAAGVTGFNIYSMVRRCRRRGAGPGGLPRRGGAAGSSLTAIWRKLGES